MGINVGYAQSRARELSGYAGDLRGIKSGLAQQKIELNQAWKSVEMQYVNRAIDMITAELTSLAAELDSLGGDIIAVANEIRQEEIAAEEARRAAAEAEARRAAAATVKPNSTSYNIR